MSTNKIEGKLISGCIPQDANLKQKYEQLAQIFAPVVYFDPKERFFPVDLPSTIAASALYRFDGKPYNEEPVEPPIKNYGSINPVDLSLAERNFFTTVVGWKPEIKDTENAKIEMPVPKIDEVYKKYSTGVIPAKLTTYSTVCIPKDVPNFQFLQQFPPRYDEIMLYLSEEGLLINYYLYFPAMDSPEVKREGDWSGISILFGRRPEIDKLSMPLLTCYFKKLGHFLWAGSDGFRMWDKVKRVKDQTTGLDTHPIVYVSLGRHNCYYEPVNVTIPIDPPWKPGPDSNKIEGGDYTPAPTGGTLTGGWDPMFPTWTYAVFDGLMLLFEACGSLGCVEFDTSGLPGGSQDVNDSIKSGGYESDPESAQPAPPMDDSYPSKPPVPGVPQNLKLNVVYVDVDDPATKANWGYKGSWGAAEVEDYTYWDYYKGRYEYYTSHWGRFGGFERPNLGPWFLWNLYWDTVFGSGGGSGYQIPSP